ncbi:MAG TPA: murein biosynthesis integral membrane protein MurJ [Candidatus Saccharimonadales bacterium]|nr:murein biosynthesis integral membrane protein MurJ [Candidatus Saccharimonadales bacterium]
MPPEVHAKPAKKSRLIPISSIALLLISSQLVGQVLGFLRTKMVANNFPTTGPQSTDAYFAAFNIPDFFFFTLAAGALGVAFMPVLSDHLARGDRKGMWQLSASLMNLLSMVMLGVAVIIIVFAEPLIHYIVAPKLTGANLDNAVTIMRLLAFNPLLFTLSGVLTATQQTLGRFFFYAIAPLFYNLAIIVSILVFRHNIGIVGLGIGALVGGIIQLLVVIVGLQGLNFHWRPKILWGSKDFRTILRNLPPRSIDQGIDQIENIVETNIANHIRAGYVSYYNYAYTLATAPILLIGSAISTAAFPRLNMRLSQGRPDLFRRDFLMVLRAIIWITMPVAVICYFARGYLARIIFGSDAPEIAVIFGFLTTAIVFRTIYTIISRWFYAQKDTVTPLIISIFTIGLNIFLAYTLSRPTSYGVVGLAIAQSLVAAFEVIILFVIMVIRDHKLLDGAFFGGVGRILSVTGFSIVAGATVASVLPLGVNDKGYTVLGTKLLVITAVVFTVHITVSALFGLDEVKPVFRRLKQFILKPIRVQF